MAICAQSKKRLEGLFITIHTVSSYVGKGLSVAQIELYLYELAYEKYEGKIRELFKLKPIEVKFGRTQWQLSFCIDTKQSPYRKILSKAKVNRRRW